MFPTLYHFLKDIFGVEIRFLEIVNTFGLFVAFAIAGAYWAMQKEFARKAKLGQFPSRITKQTLGIPFSKSEYISSGLISFFFGFKIIYLAVNTGPDFSPQEHIFNTDGNLLFGLIFAALSLSFKYYTDKKQRLNPPVEKEFPISLSEDMGTVTGVALISGFFGAKLFHILETPENFNFKSIVEQFFTTGGWTFYGGLIMGGLGVLLYTRSKGYHWLHVLDGGGPAMMLSYGIGRFGCHFAGDGDWGVANLSKSSWLPDWAWAYKYPHNVLGKDYASSGMEPIPGCTGDYCFQLSTPVFPTPLYEALSALLIFAILWFWLRNKSLLPGQYFGVYLIFAGVERFMIEIIREHGDSLYRFGGMVFSQAQMISLLLIGLGMGLIVLAKMRILKVRN